jgi:hypothetical protein
MFFSFPGQSVLGQAFWEAVLFDRAAFMNREPIFQSTRVAACLKTSGLMDAKMLDPLLMYGRVFRIPSGHENSKRWLAQRRCRRPGRRL